MARSRVGGFLWVCTPQVVTYARHSRGKEAPGSPFALTKGNSDLGEGPTGFGAKHCDANRSHLRCKQTSLHGRGSHDCKFCSASTSLYWGLIGSVLSSYNIQRWHACRLMFHLFSFWDVRLWDFYLRPNAMWEKIDWLILLFTALKKVFFTITHS